ncbi:protein FAR-RED IMPAIRED RESPONSE 1-like isoform X2 [Juglans regia]|uniref:Protein FAR1-RELATED SEQUENCE n=1 Tax=Juglans regia TaxID=51240 RepID=A0A6P9EP16_JUGRE|nr:protein FAR-RED IMPAIRED RESPONSE 1-like isoform X2 [Juglans regia]
MYGYYGAMPPPFFPPFVPHPNTHHYPWGGQQSLARPFFSPIPYLIAFNPRSSRHVEQVAEPTSDSRQRNTAESGTRDKSNDFGGFKEKHVDEGSAEVANDAAHHLRAEEEVDNDGRENFMNDGKDNDSLEEPKSGMLFSSKEELFAYYKQYGKQTGFGVMTQRSKREVDGSAKYLTLGCAHGGKARNRTSNVSKPRPTTKTNFKAKINVMLVDGSWRVTTVENTHNHALNSFKSNFFRCNRNDDDVVKRQLDENDEIGIQMNKSFDEVGELKNIQFIEKDCRNSIDKTRHLQLGEGGAKALCEYFERMQHENDGFYVMMDLDDDSRLRNVFWADARSRVAYEYFGDVVMFDTTYLTNSYNMPLALILGVNHHGQLIFLGVGLISIEDTNTFVWLFHKKCNCNCLSTNPT